MTSRRRRRTGRRRACRRRPSAPGGSRASSASSLEARHVEPFLLLPALQAELRELHALRALEEAPAERPFAGDVPEEQLPLRLERVVVALVGHFFPALKEVDRLRDVRIPDRLRRFFIRLKETTAQAGDRAAFRAVDLQREEIVAPHAHGPRA